MTGEGCMVGRLLGSAGLGVALLCLLVLLVLLVLPATRWLVVQQVRCLISGRGVSPLLDGLGGHEPFLRLNRGALARELAAAAARFPDDFELQLAGALMGARKAPLLERLRALEARFPGRASLQAHLLRYACDSGVRITGREDPLEPPEPSPPSAWEPVPPTAEQFAAFDQAASTGQRLDPDNAFFPWMRAIGLLQAHRDREAWAALHEAAAMSRWEDYANEEPLARWRLRNLAWGECGAVPRHVVFSGTLLPHLSPLRQVAKAALQASIRDETEGRVAEGIARRHDLLRCAGLMRGQATMIITSLVGGALGATAVNRPGGAPPVALPQEGSARERTLALLNAYLPYLERAGHNEAAAWVRAELEAGAATKELSRDGLRAEANELGPLATWWLADVAVLASGAWCLLLAATAAALTAVPAGRPTILTLAGLGLLGMVAAGWRLTRGADVLATWWSTTRWMENGEPSAKVTSPGQALAVTVAAGLALPGLATLVLLLLGLSGRTAPMPLISGGVLLIAGGLGLVYAGMVAATGRGEARLLTHTERRQQHEGRYWADLVGREWPGVVPRPRGTSPGAG